MLMSSDLYIFTINLRMNDYYCHTLEILGLVSWAELRTGLTLERSPEAPEAPRDPSTGGEIRTVRAFGHGREIVLDQVWIL